MRRKLAAPPLALGALCASFFVTPPAAAADPQRTPAPEPSRQKAAVSVGYVLVPFVVVDRKGRPVPDLKARDVTLLVDWQPVQTDLFEKSDDAPVSFTILLDGSGSMGLAGKMNGARAALSALLDARRPGDDFALHVFSAGEVREVVPFTKDAEAIRRAVADLRPFGKTAFFDALAKMPDRSLLGGNGSRAIVLLTDGLDNASSLSREDLSALLEGIDVPVYPIGLRPPGSLVRPPGAPNQDSLVDLEILDHVARSSGGRLAVSDEPTALVAAVNRLSADLRAQYLLGFTPTGVGPVRYRRISLRLTGPVRQVRVRAGYVGTEPPRVGGAVAPKKGRGR